MPVKKIEIPRPSYKVEEVIDRVSEPYLAAEEKIRVGIGGEGQVVLSHGGDGDVEIVTRIYIDGILEETIEGNKPGVISIGWTTGLTLAHYATAGGTFYNSSSHAVGWRY